MCVYTIKEYITSKESLDSKISAIESLIDSMILSAVDAIDNSGFASYSVDTGQSKITTEYRSIDDISKGIKSLEKILQMYINRRNGHITILRG